MKAVFKRIFIKNWPRKLVAFVTAIIVWLIVNQTVTLTRTIPDVPIRIIDIPENMTVEGLRSNGRLQKRIQVTLTGNRSVIEDIRPGDIEIAISAEGHTEGWIVKLDKRNLVSLSPQLDLKDNIMEMSARDIYVKLTPIYSAEIPVTITVIGDPPSGYQFLDVWPEGLKQTVSGPEQQVKELQERGLELKINLNRVNRDELETLRQSTGTDEVSFPIPPSWKMVEIPFIGAESEPLTDPRASDLRIDFLKQRVSPLGTDLPIALYFPSKFRKEVNPDRLSLADGPLIRKENGMAVLNMPLFASDVGHLFLDVIRDNVQLTVIVVPQAHQKSLDTAIEFINLKALEDAYVEAAIVEGGETLEPKLLDKYLRNRFNTYVRKMTLYTEDRARLDLQADLVGNSITLFQKGR